MWHFERGSLSTLLSSQARNDLQMKKKTKFFRNDMSIIYINGCNIMTVFVFNYVFVTDFIQLCCALYLNGIERMKWTKRMTTYTNIRKVASHKPTGIHRHCSVWYKQSILKIYSMATSKWLIDTSFKLLSFTLYMGKRQSKQFVYEESIDHQKSRFKAFRKQRMINTWEILSLYFSHIPFR